ncbi:hypothetical protein T459_28454 [Capsicum annuum]|uniref:Uncharacterized protein n=1 Tax=Capsicum annuum TaxID=4072 RepID=A0A2G2YGW6_CAPAN|nr:hypothetical protein T459_28454 [Capsicum annuum]
MYIYPVNNVRCDLEELMTKCMAFPEKGFFVHSMQLPSIPGRSGSGTYPCGTSSSKTDNIFDLEGLFPDHMFGLGK